MMITAVAMKRKDPFPNHQPPKPLHLYCSFRHSFSETCELVINWLALCTQQWCKMSFAGCSCQELWPQHNTVDCKLTNLDESLVVAAIDRHESVHCHINHDHDYNWLTPHRSGRPLRINLMSRYICFSQNGRFDVSFEELVSKVQNPGGFFRKIVF